MNYIPYFILLVYPLVGPLLEKKNSKFKPESTFIVFLLFAALRGNGNGDYFNYFSSVSAIQSFSDLFISEGFAFELGFRIIALVNNFLGITPQFTIFMLNLISLVIVRYIINKYSNNKWLSWFIYFPFLILFDMHHTRSAVAMSFILLMMHLLLIERKLLLSIGITYLAYIFHKSSIFPALAIFGYYLYERIRQRGLLSVKSGNVLLAITLFVRVVIQPKALIIRLAKQFPASKMLYKLASYLSNSRWSYPFRLYDPRMILIGSTYFAGVYSLDREQRENRVYSDMILAGLVIAVILSESTMMAIRLYSFFNIISILIVPRILATTKFESLNIRIRDKISGILKKDLPSFKPVNVFYYVSYFAYGVYLIMQQVPYYFFF